MFLLVSLGMPPNPVPTQMQHDLVQALSNALCSHAGLRELQLGSNGFGDHGAQAKLRLQTADLPLAQATAESQPKQLQAHIRSNRFPSRQLLLAADIKCRITRKVNIAGRI